MLHFQFGTSYGKSYSYGYCQVFQSHKGSWVYSTQRWWRWTFLSYFWVSFTQGLKPCIPPFINAIIVSKANMFPWKAMRSNIACVLYRLKMKNSRLCMWISLIWHLKYITDGRNRQREALYIRILYVHTGNCWCVEGVDLSLVAYTACQFENSKINKKKKTNYYDELFL